MRCESNHQKPRLVIYKSMHACRYDTCGSTATAFQMDAKQGWSPLRTELGKHLSDPDHRLRATEFDLSPVVALNDEGSRNFSAGVPVLADPVTVTSTAAAGLTAAWAREFSAEAAASTLSLACISFASCM